MTRRTPLLVVAEPELISSGLAPDRHPILQPLWESATNVRFYQGKVRRLIPASLLHSSGGDYFTRGIHQQQNSDGIRWLYYAVVSAIGTVVVVAWNGVTAYIVETLVGQATNDSVTAKAAQVDFVQWGDWTLWNIGSGAIRRAAIDLPNAPTCIGIMKKQNQLFALGTGLGRRGVAWSDADDIETWAPAADNLAGSLTIEELKTPMRGFAKLGQHIACYSEDQLALVQWVGAPAYYGQRVALDGIGVVGKAAVCADGRLNYGMSRNGAWQTDGNDFRYIDHGIISDYLQERVNWDQSGKIVVSRNDVTRCIEFHFPAAAATENNEAWSFDPSTGSWGMTTAYQAAAERVLFDKPLAGVGSSIYMLDDNPDAVAALSLVTKPLLIDLPDTPGLHIDARIDEVEVAALKATNVEFRLRNATDIDGPWESTDWQALSPDMRTYRLPYLPTGTYHKLEFRNTATNWSFDLQGFALFGSIEGTKRDSI